jgi:hypothetical protein
MGLERHLKAKGVVAVALSAPEPPHLSPIASKSTKHQLEDQLDDFLLILLAKVDTSGTKLGSSTDNAALDNLGALDT